MKEHLDDLYLRTPEPNQSTLLALRSILLAFDPHISETMKYGMPCFLYKRNILCYLWTDKKTGEPYIFMAEGNHLHTPGLEQGNRLRMKIFRINPHTDIPIQTILLILKEAIKLYKRGIVKLK